MDAAGVGRIYAKELPATTYEGDNLCVFSRLHCSQILSLSILIIVLYSILNLQVARAALKTLGTLRSNPTVPLSASSSYLSSLFPAPSLPIAINSSTEWLNHSVQLQILSLRACYQVSRLERLLASGKSFGDLSWECVNVSRAIVEAFIVRRMLEAVGNEKEGLLCVGIGEGEKKVIRDVINFVSLTSGLQDLRCSFISFANIILSVHSPHHRAIPTRSSRIRDYRPLFSFSTFSRHSLWSNRKYASTN